MHGCWDDGDAAFNRGAFGWVGNEVVGDCEEESGAGRATDGEKLVGVTADGTRRFGAHSYTCILSRNWVGALCFGARW